MINQKWQKAQEWEKDWHGDCLNSLNEELKQLVYAEKMGITFTSNSKTPYNIDLNGKSVLDIGGGAYSLLLKASNFKQAIVVDPLLKNHPDWVKERYLSVQFYPVSCKGEELADFKPEFEIFDEIWIYNVLEHVENPAKIVENAKSLSKIIRVFEWVDTRVNIGHIHSLNQQKLDEWLDGEGKVENIKRGGAIGKAYYGIFKGNHYDKI